MSFLVRSSMASRQTNIALTNNQRPRREREREVISSSQFLPRQKWVRGRGVGCNIRKKKTEPPRAEKSLSLSPSLVQPTLSQHTHTHHRYIRRQIDILEGKKSMNHTHSTITVQKLFVLQRFQSFKKKRNSLLLSIGIHSVNIL